MRLNEKMMHDDVAVVDENDFDAAVAVAVVVGPHLVLPNCYSGRELEYGRVNAHDHRNAVI